MSCRALGAGVCTVGQASSFQIQPTRVRLEGLHHALGATGGGLWVSSFVVICEIRLECCPWCLVRGAWLPV